MFRKGGFPEGVRENRPRILETPVAVLGLHRCDQPPGARMGVGIGIQRRTRIGAQPFVVIDAKKALVQRLGLRPLEKITGVVALTLRFGTHVDPRLVEEPSRERGSRLVKTQDHVDHGCDRLLPSRDRGADALGF